jgi:nucleotide-binding universal stress UspA family protein
MTKQINVGFNGSVSSIEAVRWAAEEAERRGVRLRLISCFSTPAIPGAGLGLTAAEAFTSVLDETHDALLQAQALIARSHPDLAVTAVASSDPPSTTLIDHLSADDLVVVGATTHHAGAGRVLGSTARHVVRHSPCPVVVVRGSTSCGHTERVVVGVDGSTASRKALQWAGDEADRYGTELVVVHAWMYPDTHSFSESSQARDLTQVDAACLLDREVEAAHEQFACEVSGQLVDFSPSAALLATVRDGDLLVVGSEGHGSVHTTLFGSTVSTLLDQCPVPTVVVRTT